MLANKRLKDFIHLLLSFGNELNINHPKYGNFKGFKIKFLSEIIGIKSNSDSTSLLDVLIDEYCYIYGNPHIFHNSEHLLLKEIANSSYKRLLESYNQFYQEYCRLSSIEFCPEIEKHIRNFVNLHRKDVEFVLDLMNQSKDNINKCHQYFAEDEEYDEEGRVNLFYILSRFYDKYIDCVKKKWENISNRDSRRFTLISEKKKK